MPKTPQEILEELEGGLEHCQYQIDTWTVRKLEAQSKLELMRQLADEYNLIPKEPEPEQPVEKETPSEEGESEPAPEN